MKHLKNFVLVLLAGLVTVITSCKKDNTDPSGEEPIISTPTTPALDKSNVIALINNLSTPLETYTVDVANYDTYYCANGTIIDIYPDAFLTQSGAIVTGIVTIEVKDILSKKDMILNNAIPVSNGQLLVSGGEVYFSATQGGQKLKINPASSVNIKVPADNAPSNQMLEFYSQGPANLSNSDLNWTTTATNTIPIDSSTGHLYYDFNLDQTSWFNCDFFHQFSGAKTTFTVNTTGICDNSNSVIYLSMNGSNALVKISTIDFMSKSQVFVSFLNSVPVGLGYTLVAIMYDGTNYYYGAQALTMTTNMVISMPALSQTTKTQIETNLNTLP